jgi:hypothetical protein
MTQVDNSKGKEIKGLAKEKRRRMSPSYMEDDKSWIHGLRFQFDG